MGVDSLCWSNSVVTPPRSVYSLTRNCSTECVSFSCFERRMGTGTLCITKIYVIRGAGSAFTLQYVARHIGEKNTLYHTEEEWRLFFQITDGKTQFAARISNIPMKLRMLCPHCPKHPSALASTLSGCMTCDGSGAVYQRVSFMTIMQSVCGISYTPIYTAH